MMSDKYSGPVGLCEGCRYVDLALSLESCATCYKNSNYERVEHKKKTLYVGVDIEGKKYSDIMSEIKILHEVAENLFGEKLEVLDSYRVGELRRRNVEDTYRHLEDMKNADYTIVAYAKGTPPIMEPIVEKGE